MSYFEGQDAGWSQHRRQSSWDPTSRSGVSPAQQLDNETAFSTQFEEVSRAADNLTKGGKGYAAPNQPGGQGMHGRRESMPMMGAFQRQLGEFGGEPRGGQRHMSVSEDPSRGGQPHATGPALQGYLAHQRFPSRPSEAEQMMQAKRRAAAQRERELRNYHQEQQYNRKGTSGSKSDRSMSPGMSEEDRRELIARQHRALYGDNSQLYVGSDSSSPRPLSQDARVLAGAGGSGHGSSPLAFDAFTSATAGDSGLPLAATTAGPSASPRDGTQSPQSAVAAGKQFAMFDSAQAAAKASGNAPSLDAAGHASKVSQGGVAPIGTRPIGGVPGKRNTPPAPSPLGFGGAGERSQSAASNAPSSAPNQEKGVGLGWNSGSGAWGPSRQASVWG